MTAKGCKGIRRVEEGRGRERRGGKRRLQLVSHTGKRHLKYPHHGRGQMFEGIDELDGLTWSFHIRFKS